jgi:hypothetical protein
MNNNNNNARNSSQTPDFQARVCAVYAKSKQEWRSPSPAKVCLSSHSSEPRLMALQVVLPWILKGNGAAFEKKRTEYIQKWTHADSAAEVAKVQRFLPLVDPPAGVPRNGATPVRGEPLFSAHRRRGARLSRLPGVAGQFLLVQNAKFTVRCFEPPADPHTPPADVPNARNFPQFSYLSVALQQDWFITPEHLVC